MSAALYVLVAVLVYPVIAGMVYRGVLEEGPPEPERCDRDGRNTYRQPCERAGRTAPDIAVSFPNLYCDACNAWNRWAATHQPDDARALTLALLWPLYPLWAVPRRLFRAGANVRAIPARSESATPEHVEAP